MLLMSNGVNAVFSGFENSYHQKLNRNFINQYLYAFGVSIILVLILISTIIGFGFLEIYVLHPIYKSLNLGDATSELEWLRALKFLFFVMMIYLPFFFSGCIAHNPANPFKFFSFWYVY